MSKWGRTGALIVLFFVLSQAFLHTNPVSADIAPPAPPVGSNLFPPVEPTNVRMVKEAVLIEIAADSSNPNGTARVTADFQMRNLADTAETMQVRFPLGWPSDAFRYNPLSLVGV